MSATRLTRGNAPATGQTLAFPHAQMRKRAALLFDRIYVHPVQRMEVPNDLMFWSSGVDQRFHDLSFAVLYAVTKITRNDVREFLGDEYPSDVQGEPDFRDVIRAVLRDPCPDEESLQQCSRELGTVILKSHYSVQYQIVLECGQHVVALFPSWIEYNRNVVGTSSVAYEAALQTIPSILEDELTWEQVVEFRKDREAKRKLRALRSWLQSGLTAATLEEATDKIEQKVANYEWALKKHGVKTVTGALTAVLDSKFIGSVAGAAGVSALMGGSVWGALTGSALMLSKMSVWLVERRMELLDIQRGSDSEVALICDARNKQL
jgi:hypothetical protein